MSLHHRGRWHPRRARSRLGGQLWRLQQLLLAAVIPVGPGGDLPGQVHLGIDEEVLRAIHQLQRSRVP